MTGAGPEPIQMGKGKPGWRSRLTPRLRRVAVLLADGYTNEAIARRLGPGVDEGAVRKDVHALYRLAKLPAGDRERNPRVVLAVRLQKAMARERDRRAMDGERRETA